MFFARVPRSIIFFDKVDKLALGNAVRVNSMRELLRKSDVVSIHVDGDELNRDIFGEAEFKLMKSGSVLPTTPVIVSTSVPVTF